MLIKDLFKKFNISSESIPQTILNIELDEEADNFNKQETKNTIRNLLPTDD